MDSHLRKRLLWIFLTIMIFLSTVAPVLAEGIIGSG
jgi:hypothetical protein